jgi:NADH-quinone oxidoreductase subunit N
VIGSMVSLAYYLRVVAAVWMRPGAERVAPAPLIAGASPEAGSLSARLTGVPIEVVAVAVGCGAAVVAFGIVPSPLLDLAADAARAIFG